MWRFGRIKESTTRSDEIEEEREREREKREILVLRWFFGREITPNPLATKKKQKRGLKEKSDPTNLKQTPSQLDRFSFE